MSALALPARPAGSHHQELVIVALRFNPPPGWPPPPEGFTPDPGWRPDPSWPPLPPGWQLWVSDDPASGTGTSLTPGYIGYGADPAAAQWQAAGWGPNVMPQSGTDGLAIAGFVLGLLGFVGISAILGIVFGSVALNRIRRSAQGGRGLAIAGIVLGSCWIAFWVLIIVVAAVSGTTSGSGSSAMP
jgi:hypothetical protein